MSLSLALLSLHSHRPAAASYSAPAASDPASAAATTAAVAEATDGPVLSVVSKRLCALRKKYNRILQTEESLAACKMLNREQEEVLHSKPVVSALINELECFHAPLSSTLAEELSSRCLLLLLDIQLSPLLSLIKIVKISKIEEADILRHDFRTIYWLMLLAFAIFNYRNKQY